MTTEQYLNDSYLTIGEAQILEIGQNQVILDQTIFYPTGGGQEHDLGVMVQNNREYEVVKVKREQGRIVHYLSSTEGLQKGPVHLQIDWERRYGLMRHHSLLHVLAAVVQRKFGALCTGNQIYPDRARIDFTQLRELSEEETAEIVAETNEEINRNHPITTRWITREEADHAPSLIKTVVNLLPPSVTTVRLVAIGDIDEQACGGTHVKETSEIGHFAITKIKSKGQDSRRLEVVAMPISGG
ncbi:alanyl-tRNA editing protein [Brevibacillus ruminantium]|uniref:Alanyl-tRNA editing protein n=1 Tax=Brevibacillus ruminantium TaxID=2950604 RepID=A0ABY4WM40_9BACL|nr:alanyl-tRNA editing protein [Brevibacillus ruminantium]USG68225.1 alanyl-tRNA editing protein [Brevibacillus ruminantium]